MVLYRIKSWSLHFEGAASRKRKKISALVHPLDLDPAASSYVDGLADAMVIWGVWYRLRELAANAPVRGELATERGPLTLEQMARVGRIPPDQLARALEVLSGDEVGWIEQVEAPPPALPDADKHAGAGSRDPAADSSDPSRPHASGEADSPCEGAPTARQSVAERGRRWQAVTPKKTNQRQFKKKIGAALASQRDGIVWTPKEGWTGITAETRARWRSAYPDCDLDQSLEQMSVWLHAHPARAARGDFSHFTVNWLKREQDAHVSGKARQSAPPAQAPGRRDHRSDREAREYKEDGFDVTTTRIGLGSSDRGEAGGEGKVAGASPGPCN